MSGEHRLNVIVLIDALGWDIVEHFDFARGLLPVAGPTKTVFGYSSAAIPTLLSGEPPDRHGAWAMYRYDPERSPFKCLRYLPPLPHALEWRTRVLTKRVLGWRNTIAGYYDLYEIPLRVLANLDVAQRGDPFAPGGMPVETVIDAWRRQGVPYRLWTYRTPEEENFAALKDAVRSDADVLMLYTAELDALMHRTGIFDERVGRALERYEAHLREIMDRAASTGRPFSLYVFSDHGMTDVHTVVDLWSEVKRWGYRLGRDLNAFFDSTMGRFWCSPVVCDELTQRLDGTGWGRVVPGEELARLGCGFRDRSYGDIIFLVSPGYLIVPSYMGREPLQAMHGYDPEDRYSRGCFMTADNRFPVPVSIKDIKRYLLRVTSTTGYE